MAAFTDAMREFGYKRDGTRIDGLRDKPEVKGTLCLLLRPALVSLDYEGLMQACRRVVVGLMGQGESVRENQETRHTPMTHRHESLREKAKYTPMGARNKAWTGSKRAGNHLETTSP